MRPFPRLHLNGGTIPMGEPLPVGMRFLRVDPPNSTSLNPLFRTWRMVTWEIVLADNSWKNSKDGTRTYAPTKELRVIDERALTDSEIAEWSAYGEAQ